MEVLLRSYVTRELFNMLHAAHPKGDERECSLQASLLFFDHPSN